MPTGYDFSTIDAALRSINAAMALWMDGLESEVTAAKGEDAPCRYVISEISDTFIPAAALIQRELSELSRSVAAEIGRARSKETASEE